MTAARALLGVGLVLGPAALLAPAVGVPLLLAVTGGGALWARARGGSARRYLRELDELAALGERTLVASALALMTLVVFVDVVWRTSHSLEGAAAWGLSGALLGLCVVGGLTARWPGASLGKRLGAGLGAFGFGALCVAALHAAPTGFGWSQRLALVLLLWVGMLGASLASKWGRHIQVDAVRRLVPARWQRTFEVAAEIVTLLLLLLLALLARDYVLANVGDWVRSEGRSAVFESLAIPYWAASAPILIGFSLMLARSLRALLEGPVQVELLESLGAGERSRSSTGSDPSTGVSAP